jgi:hypothetical protein
MAYTSRDADAAWGLTPEQNEHIKTLTNVHDITDAIKNFGIENGRIRPMPEAGIDVLVDVPQSAPVAASETKTVTIDGKTIVGSQEVIDAALRVEFAKNPPQPQPQGRDNNGRFVADDANGTAAAKAARESAELRAADNAMLELKFKRGEISTADYLKQTGAMDEYLASRGIDVAAHQQQAQREAAEITDWATVTTQFLKQNPDWPGGEELKDRMAHKLEELHLTQNPSVESLERAQAAIALEDQMRTCQDSRRMAELQEMYRVHVEGRSGQPDYRL